MVVGNSCGFLSLSEDSGGPSDTMKMDEVNVGGLGVGVTVDIQRTDGEYGKRRKNGVSWSVVPFPSAWLSRSTAREGVWEAAGDWTVMPRVCQCSEAYIRH